MATMQKRPSVDREEPAHRSKKKRKCSGARKESDSKSFRKKKRDRHKNSSPPKIRSIAELVKLVSTGAVNLPQGLEHYVDERAVLFDQIFTILSPDDVKGMLPDILKGLKTKNVKGLCYKQLKHMTREDIFQTLSPEEPLSPDLNFDSVLRQLMSEDAPEQPPMVDRQSADASFTMCGLSTPKSLTIDVGTSGESSTVVVSSILQDSHSSANPDTDKKERKRGTDAALHVSDVSDDEGACSTTQLTERKAKYSHSRGMDCTEGSFSATISAADEEQVEVNVTSHDIVNQELMNLPEPNQRDEDVELCQTNYTTEQQCSAAVSSDGVSDDGSSSGEDWEKTCSDEVSEAARLLEMELRKRALESELKKKQESRHKEEERTLDDVSGLDGDMESDGNAKETSVGRATKYPTVCCRDTLAIGKDEDGGKSEGTASLGGGLELQLRQRALQSLLAKRNATD